MYSHVNPSSQSRIGHLLNRLHRHPGHEAPAARVDAAHLPSPVPRNGKLSNEMERAANHFHQMWLKKYREDGMPLMNWGSPETESQAAQMLFAAVMAGSYVSEGNGRTKPVLVESLQSRAQEMPRLVERVIDQRHVRKQFQAATYEGGARASRALVLLARNPQSAVMLTYFLPSVLALSHEAATSAEAPAAEVAAHLANRLAAGFGQLGSIDRAATLEAGKAAVQSAVDAQLIGEPLARAIDAKFAALYPEGVRRDASREAFAGITGSRFASDLEDFTVVDRRHGAAVPSTRAPTHAPSRAVPRAADDQLHVWAQPPESDPSPRISMLPTGVAQPGPLDATSRRSRISEGVLRAWNHLKRRDARSDHPQPVPARSRNDEAQIRTAVAARVGMPTQEEREAAPARSSSVPNQAVRPGRPVVSSATPTLRASTNVLDPGDRDFIRRAFVPVGPFKAAKPPLVDKR